MTVITAGEFDDFIASGEAPGEADSGHGRFGTAVAHAYFFDRGHDLHKEFSHFHFKGIGCAKAGAVLQGLGDGCLYIGVIVPVNSGTPGADEVDQLITVGGMEVGAFGPLGKEGSAADRAEGPNGRINAAGNDPGGAFQKVAGLCVVHEIESLDASGA